MERSGRRAERPEEQTAERRAARRGQLLDAAIAVVRRDGARATMEDMAAAGGVSKPILYRHFTDRDGLVSAITDAALAELGEIIAARVNDAAASGTYETNRALTDAVFEWIERDTELFRFLVDHTGTSDAATAFVTSTSEIVEQGLATALVAAGRDPGPAAVWARAFIGAAIITARWWTSVDTGLSRERLVDQFTDLGWYGMLGPRRSR